MKNRFEWMFTFALVAGLAVIAQAQQNQQQNPSRRVTVTVTIEESDSMPSSVEASFFVSDSGQNNQLDFMVEQVEAILREAVHEDPATEWQFFIRHSMLVDDPKPLS